MKTFINQISFIYIIKNPKVMNDKEKRSKQTQEQKAATKKEKEKIF